MMYPKYLLITKEIKISLNYVSKESSYLKYSNIIISNTELNFNF